MSSHSRVAKKLSAIALSKQSPTEPMDGATPISRQRFPKAYDCVLVALVAVMNDAGWAALPQRHVQRLENQFGAQVIGHRPATTRRLKASTTTARNRNPAQVGT